MTLRPHCTIKMKSNKNRSISRIVLEANFWWVHIIQNVFCKYNHLSFYIISLFWTRAWITGWRMALYFLEIGGIHGIISYHHFKPCYGLNKRWSCYSSLKSSLILQHVNHDQWAFNYNRCFSFFFQFLANMKNRKIQTHPK